MNNQWFFKTTLENHFGKEASHYLLKRLFTHDDMLFRSSHRSCSVRKGVLRNFAKFIGKHLRQSLFFKNFIKKETVVQVFREISKNTFFTEHLQATAFCYYTITKSSMISLKNLLKASSMQQHWWQGVPKLLQSHNSIEFEFMIF